MHSVSPDYISSLTTVIEKTLYFLIDEFAPDLEDRFQCYPGWSIEEFFEALDDLPFHLCSWAQKHDKPLLAWGIFFCSKG